MAVLAFAGANLAHEIAGHCSAAFLLGGGCSFVSTTDVRLRPETPLDLFTFTAAAGTLANFIAAGLACAALRRWRTSSPPVRLLLWLSLAVNLFTAGYMAVSPLIFFGAWHNIIVTAEGDWLWRALISACGAALWWLAWLLCRHELGSLVGTAADPLMILGRGFPV